MGKFDHRGRPALRTSTSIDPKNVLEDIDTRIRTLDPNATPFLSLTSKISKGKTPTSHKIQVVEYHNRDQMDFCSSLTIGGGNYARFASMVLDQPSRPTMGNIMYYYVQDKFFIAATGQTVEVIFTPTAAIQISGSDFTMTAGNGLMAAGITNRSVDGSVIVRNIEPHPIIPFTTSDVVFLGRTIYESQNIEAMSRQRDLIWDCNFVEHKEAVFNMTEDQKKIVVTRAGIPDWNFQQNETFKEFKQDVEMTLWWGEREVDLTEPSRPKRHMRGMHNSIRTNVSVYNPMTTFDYEELVDNFLYDQAFRFNPNGKNKFCFAGGRFLSNFNKAYREYRRTTSLDPKSIGKNVGLDIDTYSIPGGFKIAILRNEILRQNTSLENWCYVIDPATLELRIVKDFNSRMYNLDNERLLKTMIEWQGTMAHHTEQANALLRTV